MLFSRLIGTIFISLIAIWLLTGCGGEDETSSSSQDISKSSAAETGNITEGRVHAGGANYQGVISLATLTEENIPVYAQEALSQTMLSTRDLDGMTTGYSMLSFSLMSNQLILYAYQLGEERDFDQKMSGPCGGSALVSSTVSGTMVKGTISYDEFCITHDEVINGSVSYRAEMDTEKYGIARAMLTFDELDSYHAMLSGTLKSSYENAQNFTVLMNMLTLNKQTGREFLLEDFIYRYAHADFYDGQSFDVELAGRIYENMSGYADVSTGQILHFEDMQPKSGALLLDGENEAKVRYSITEGCEVMEASAAK